MAKQSENSKPPYVRSSAAKVHPSIDLDADPSSYSLEKFRLYETRQVQLLPPSAISRAPKSPSFYSHTDRFQLQRFYLIGSDRNKRFYRVLKIDRSEPDDLNLSEDPVVYSPQEIKNLLQRIAEGNRATGGLTFVAKVFGIAG